MCDTIVIARPGEPIWIAKNSDRAPDEHQIVDWAPASQHGLGTELSCTGYTVPQVRNTIEVILSRPQWMWGCEMGVNSAGVAVANEAVFTRFPVAERGLSGMDLQRLALERSTSAAEAAQVLIGLLSEHMQGGAMGPLRYHSSFVIADPKEAWILETAGQLWALKRVLGVATISNALTIGADFDRVHPRAYEVARARGWCRSAADFDFAKAFGSRFYGLMTGAGRRASCTSDLCEQLMLRGRMDAAGVAAVLRDHGGGEPSAGWRMQMPCAHASYLPTRAAGQTTASMIACLASPGSEPDSDFPSRQVTSSTSETGHIKVWMTGTSSPCLSVFKPLAFGADCLAELRVSDPEQSLWWRHERLHRATMLDYARRRQLFEKSREELEASAWAADGADPSACANLWRRHHRAIPEWTERADALSLGAGSRARVHCRPFYRYWAAKARALGQSVG